MIPQLTNTARRIQKVYCSPVLIWHRFQWIKSYWRALMVRVQCNAYGAHVVFGRNVVYQHPVRFQGFGSLIVADNVQFGYIFGGTDSASILLQPRPPSAQIRIGESTVIMNSCKLIALTQIVIGAHCLIGPDCTFLDADFHDTHPDKRNLPGQSAAILVDDNVWCGAGVTVLKGVHIGRDAVVGTRSVVTRNVDVGAIVAGAPARTIGSVYA